MHLPEPTPTAMLSQWLGRRECRLRLFNYVTPGCGRSRRSPNLEVCIAPGRRAEILIAVTAGGYCLTSVCSRSCPHVNSIFAGKLHAWDPLHWVICIRHIRRHGAHLQAFHHHMSIQTGVTVRKLSSWVVTFVTLTFDLWPWPFAWLLLWSLVITPENFMMIRWWEHSQKGVTDRQTDGKYHL